MNDQHIDLDTQQTKAETIRSLVDDWNSCLAFLVQKAEEWNKGLVESYERGEISPETLMASLEPEPKQVMHPTEAWCREFKLNFGWSMVTRGSDDAQWLGYCHPDMASARQAFQEMLQDPVAPVHPALVLNFDQLWRNSYNATKFKMFYKPRAFIGQRGRKKTPGRREDKKAHHVRGARRSMTVP